MHEGVAGLRKCRAARIVLPSRFSLRAYLRRPSRWPVDKYMPPSKSTPLDDKDTTTVTKAWTSKCISCVRRSPSRYRLTNDQHTSQP